MAVVAGYCKHVTWIGKIPQMVWLSERVDGWAPLALMFALAYHVIPHAATPWSGSLERKHGTAVCYCSTVMTESNAELTHRALLLTFMLPLFAG